MAAQTEFADNNAATISMRSVVDPRLVFMYRSEEPRQGVRVTDMNGRAVGGADGYHPSHGEH